MLVTVRAGGFLETAHLLLRRGPTKRQLLVSSTWDGFPATWGELGVGPCNFFRDTFTTRYADYRGVTLRFDLNGQQITVSPKQDTAHVADADNAIFWENFYYDGQCEPQYRNIPFRDPVRTQPAEPDFSAVPIANPADTTAPDVALLEPFDAEQVGNPVRFYYFIDDAGLSGAANATLLIDGIPLVTTDKNPIVLNLGAGLHTWQIRGFDRAGNSALSELRTLNVVGGTSGASPVLENAEFFLPSEMRFRFSASPGQNYTMQFSTNLANWTTLAATNAETNLVKFTDFDATNFARFYRVLLAP
jgi:hypothetical protein